MNPSNKPAPLFKDGKLNIKDYRHALWLLYWPVFGLLFLFAEQFYPADFVPVYCKLDDYIPFNEFFYIPYVYWFVYLIGTIAYTFFMDKDAFVRMMKFVILTYSAAIIIYFIFPTCQELRPVDFPRDNFLTRLVAAFYDFDTNTNVCPSLHVIGSLAALSARLNTPRFRATGWKIFNITAAVLISVSTVFMKQHSIIDLFAALPWCLLAYVLFFRHPKNKRSSSKKCFS